MEQVEYAVVQMKALEIVDTINALKDEIEDYKQAKIGTKKSLKSLEGLIDAMSNAASELTEAAKHVQESDYVSLCGELADHSRRIEESCASLELKADVLSERLEKTLYEQSQKQQKRGEALVGALDQRIRTSDDRDRELLERISRLEAVIGRIDRNTQKGFGKERG